MNPNDLAPESVPATDLGRRPRPGAYLRPLAALVIVSLARPAFSAISVDSASNAPSSGGASTLSWPHTVGSGQNRVLIVGTSNRDGNKTVTSVTYGVSSLTRIGYQNGPGNTARMELWYLLAPASGTADIVVTWNGSNAVAAGAVSFTGVDQATPLGAFASAQGNTSSASVAVSSATGDVVIDTIAATGDAVSLTAGGSQTVQWNVGSGTAGGDVRAAGSTKPGASSVTMSWTLGASKQWGLGAVALHAAPTPPNITMTKVADKPSPKPGDNVAYTITATNGANLTNATSVVLTDPIPAYSRFQLNQATFSAGSSGLTAAITYSNNGGSTWTYTPVSGGCSAPAGYDDCVTNVRWTMTGNMPSGTSFSTGLVVRIK
jgi:uncharacterized repeat protein (TIGR01451 family)